MRSDFLHTFSVPSVIRSNPSHCIDCILKNLWIKYRRWANQASSCSSFRCTFWSRPLYTDITFSNNCCFCNDTSVLSVSLSAWLNRTYCLTYFPHLLSQSVKNFFRNIYLGIMLRTCKGNIGASKSFTGREKSTNAFAEAAFRKHPRSGEERDFEVRWKVYSR